MLDLLSIHLRDHEYFKKHYFWLETMYIVQMVAM